MRFSILLILITFALIKVSTQAWTGHDEKCEVRESISDPCDPSRYLSCNSGRCQCLDASKQIWTYKERIVSNGRSKRSPGKSKGGKAKTIGAGVGGLAVGAVAGAALAGAASNNGNYGNYGNRESSRQRQNVIKEYSCYTRVSSPCTLSSTVYNIFPSSEATNAVHVHDANGTLTNDTTTTPSTTTTRAPLDLTKLPPCVDNAVCSAITDRNKYGDSRVGECVCSVGYAGNNRDLCVKVKSSGSGVIEPTVISIMSSILFLLYSAL